MKWRDGYTSNSKHFTKQLKDFETHFLCKHPKLLFFSTFYSKIDFLFGFSFFISLFLFLFLNNILPFCIFLFFGNSFWILFLYTTSLDFLNFFSSFVFFLFFQPFSHLHHSNLKYPHTYVSLPNEISKYAKNMRSHNCCLANTWN